MRPDRIQLFPLNVVLLPGAELPLHIFEPRYRHMVQSCLCDHCEFGMLLSMPNGIARVGCTAEIVEVLERHKDGRLDILTVGRMPFRVVELFTENPLLVGQVDYLEDRETAALPAREDLVALYETCHTLVFGDYPKGPFSQASHPFSYTVTSTLPMDLLWKQQVLELRSEAERQERLVAYLRSWAPLLQKVESARGQAAGHKLSLN